MRAESASPSGRIWGCVGCKLGKASMTSRRGRHKSVSGPTIEALAGGLIALAPAYLAMESILGTLPHPTHWVGTILGIAGGYGLGSLVAAHREGRFPFGRRPARDAHRFRPGHRRTAERRDRGRDARRTVGESPEPGQRRPRERGESDG